MAAGTSVKTSPGRPVPLQFRVSGMSCAGCAATVQKAIESRPGVSSASVSVTEGIAEVVGEGFDTDSIVEAVRQRGYDARPVAEAPAPAELRSEIEILHARSERRWRFRALTGLGIWVPLELLHWLAHGQPWTAWVMFAGATAVMATAGAGFYVSALSALRRLTTNMDTLIAMGATTAYVYSLVVFAFGLDHPLYFSEAAALLGIISLGHWLEARATARAGSAVRELLELQPDEAETLDEDGSTRRIRSADVAPGDRLLVRPGARVPADGVVLEGASDVDESVVTGEAVPVLKGPGDTVVAGSVNTTGRLVVLATVDGHHTTVARIAEMVRRAQASKAAIQRVADRVCSVFVPAVLAVAALTLVGWSVAGDAPRGVVAMVTVLIISCPCALGLATPMAVMVGAGAASRRGILIKSAAALERAGRARHVVFDKTGTITMGRPEVTGIDPLPGVTGDEILRLAASVEAPSEHPLARAILAAARERGLATSAVEDFQAIPGHGVRGVVEGRLVEVSRDELASCRVTADGRALGVLRVSDAIRPDARAAIEELRADGISVTMLTGDRPDVAREVGAALGLDPPQITAGATPESKAALVRGLPEGSVMVGDGINDAAALAAADLGIALASGTTIAIESADIVLPGDRVRAVPGTLRLARATLATIRQNLAFAFLYNVLAIPLAALGLLGQHGPLVAAAAMGASDITVIGNALRLKRRLSRRSRRPAPAGMADGRPTYVYPE